MYPFRLQPGNEHNKRHTRFENARANIERAYWTCALEWHTRHGPYRLMLDMANALASNSSGGAAGNGMGPASTLSQSARLTILQIKSFYKIL